MLFPLHFNSVEQILNQLEQQPGWEKFKEYRQLLKCWDNTVNQNTAKHTRPLYIARQIFWVATSSAARAQELSFQRYTLLKRLNKQLPFTLKDVRFTASGWHQKTPQLDNQINLFSISSQYQSRAASKGSLSSETEHQDNNDQSASSRAKNAAKSWLKALEQNSGSDLFCPKCNALTSKGEMERWNLCFHCIAQEWSEEYRPSTFPELR